jgi:carbamoyltransferase
MYCLKEGGITFSDIDIIAVGYNPWAFLARGRINLWPHNFAKDFANLFIFLWYMKRLARESGARVVYIDHHLAHAASTYRCSGFTSANILTVDGSGETETLAFFRGENGAIAPVWDIPLGGPFSKKKWNSIGLVYSRITNMLSLGVHGEGKTMGLASYGEPRYDMSDILSVRSHQDYAIDRRNLTVHYAHLGRTSGEPITQKHKDLAASVQKALEDSIVAIAREAHRTTGFRNFAVAGGVMLNCNTNSRILAEDFCDALFAQAAASDGGIALGAALEAAARAGEPADFRMEYAYWGPEWSDDEIATVLDGAKASYTRHKDIEAQAAKHILAGQIVAWFQGRMELGPRALGNRSILADPTVKGINDRINEHVKHRETWRPFAPSVVEEAAPRYFEGVEKAKESPFMLHTFFVKKEYEHAFPAITHIDGSSRIQTVREDQNPRYYRLLKEMEKKNGHPMVLNTSFNDAGEPIVCTPKDALRCFFSTGIDVLVIGDCVVAKK